MHSDFFHQIPRANAQCIGYPQKGMKAYPLFAPLDLVHVNWMKISFFRELFLAQTSLGAVLADSVSKNF